MDEYKNYRSLSKQESRLVLALTLGGKRELTRRDAINEYAFGPKSADEVLGNLVRKGWLARATRGRYLLIPADWGPTLVGESNTLALAAQLTDDGYIGFSTAAAHWGLTTQLRSVIWVITRTHARDRRVNDSEIRFARLPAKVLFGFDRVEIYGYPVPMSDLEKTALDCIAWPKRAGDLAEATGILARASRRWDWDKAVTYVERFLNTALIQKFGYLCDLGQLALNDALRTRLHQRIKPSSRTYLVPRRPDTEVAHYDARWGVIANTDPSQLFKV